MSHNPLYPVFLKLHELDTLIVGAGEVGYEKLSFMLKSSPGARITVVAPEISDKIRRLSAETPGHSVQLVQKHFEPADLDGRRLAIAATNIPELNREVQQAARQRGILVNVADTPELCDFYLGAVVTRGNLKIAISTNGQSPTLAKRFRQILEEVLPEETDALLANLKIIRDRLKVNFDEKVKLLNEITAGLVERGG
jgi:precorrin-2 dehydrogenase / sirohydrochlorin ferrochelatase